MTDCSNGPLAAPIANCQPEPLQPTGDPRAGRHVGVAAVPGEVLGQPLAVVGDPGEAVAFAAQHPGARTGTVEIRQVYPLANLPS